MFVRNVCKVSFALIFFLPVQNAYAEVLAICGASHGKTFYPKTDWVHRNGEWIDDGVTGGGLTLKANKDEKFDVCYRNAIDEIGCAEAILINRDESTITVVTTDPDSIETYAFFRTDDGAAQVTWTINRSGDWLVRKVSAFEASCSFFADSAKR